MADETPRSNGNGEPPKIKLNLGTSGKPKTGPKQDTTPISLSSVPIGKAETTRIELAKATPPSPLSETKKLDPDDASKMSTMRVEIVEPQRKAETTRIDLAAAAPKPAPRIDLTQESGNTDDLFKRNTMAVGVPSGSPMTKPKTIQVKRALAGKTGESDIAPTSSTTESVSEAKKSETARIDLPPESADRPATRPKTIRIKRPDGTSARKPLMIARPAEDATVSSESVVSVAESLGEGEEEGAGIVFSVLALVALLVACVVVYVLAAQTIAPDLPFPGRIG